ncbi:MAG: N-acetyltransferase [Candidatus Caenarcaniphilales bacterium]|nr:N-acetyltransferase [Candidatus Caenarcaniphilales bacterium]
MTAEFTICKPKAQDVEQIGHLINHYAQTTQELLPRNNNHISQHLRDFWVAVSKEQKIIGCASLFLWSEQLSEIKSLAVADEFTGKGIGKVLVEKCLEDARELGQRQVFALTFKPEFFFKLGFKLTDRSQLPHKVWNECIFCPKLSNCGETAVVFEV